MVCKAICGSFIYQGKAQLDGIPPASFKDTLCKWKKLSNLTEDEITDTLLEVDNFTTTYSTTDNKLVQVTCKYSPVLLYELLE